jgi:hypothetical protein
VDLPIHSLLETVMLCVLRHTVNLPIHPLLKSVVDKQYSSHGIISIGRLQVFFNGCHPGGLGGRKR